MRVFILKEGKEYNQGVAYLDDGTMVVVDNARKTDLEDHRYLGHERAFRPPRAKMIFGRFDERTHAVHDKERVDRPAREQVPAAGAGTSV